MNNSLSSFCGACLDREMLPELLDELFSLDSNDPRALKLLKDHFDALHRELKDCGKNSAAAPSAAPAPSNRRRSDGTPDTFGANHATQLARSILGVGGSHGLE